MNCDEAFDALTDPAHARRPELQWHLDLCPRCRELQSVLAPALSLFESDAPAAVPFMQRQSLAAPSREANGSWSRRPPEPFLSTEAVRIAEQSSQRLRRSPQRTLRFVAGVLIGVAATWAGFVLTPHGHSAPSAAETATTACLWQSPEQATHDGQRPSVRTVVLSCVACHLETH